MKKNEDAKKIKRLKIFNKLTIFLGQDKIGFKLSDEEKHYTLKFLKEGLLDLHETIEGKEKFDEKYPIRRRKKVDLKKFAKAIIEYIKELRSYLVEIDINDQKYMNVEALVFPKKDVLQKEMKVEKKEIVVEEEDAMKKLFYVPMKNLNDYDFQTAIFSRGKNHYAVYRRDGKYFLLKEQDLEKSMDNAIKKFLTS